MRKLSLVPARPAVAAVPSTNTLATLGQTLVDAPKLLNDYRARQRKLKALNALSRATLEDVGVARAQYIKALERKVH
jgi:uncharacterized protein YjiS (DUF1127 family)